MNFFYVLRRNMAFVAPAACFCDTFPAFSNTFALNTPREPEKSLKKLTTNTAVNCIEANAFKLFRTNLEFTQCN